MFARPEYKCHVIDPKGKMSRGAFKIFSVVVEFLTLNPVIHKSDQFQISSPASPEILHHTV